MKNFKKTYIFLFFFSLTINLNANIFKAVINGKFEAVEKWTQEKEININETDCFGNTPLHYAAANSHHQIVQLLLDKGANYFAINNAGNRASRIASISIFKSKKVIKIFYNYLFFLAARMNDLLAIKELLNRNVKINTTDQFNQTALHHAAAGGKLEALKLLINHEADTKIRDINNNTPLDLARNYKHQEIVDFLDFELPELQIQSNKSNETVFGSLEPTQEIQPSPILQIFSELTISE